MSIHKAGLEDVDKDKVHRIIKDISKHSEYYKQEEEKLNAVKEKVQRYMEKAEEAKKNGEQWD